MINPISNDKIPSSQTERGHTNSKQADNQGTQSGKASATNLDDILSVSSTSQALNQTGESLTSKAQINAPEQAQQLAAKIKTQLGEMTKETLTVYSGIDHSKAAAMLASASI